MGVSYNTSVVTNGLILCLDAGNTKSYPGTGTTWKDLALTQDATMYGTVPYTSSGIQCFDFSTVTGTQSSNASLGFTFSANMIPTTGNYTISCWVSNLPISGGQEVMFGNANSSDGYRFGIETSNIYYLIGGAGGVGYQEGTINFLSTLNTSLWYNVVAIFDRIGILSGTPSVYLYCNGDSQNFVTIPTSQPAFTNTTPGIVRCNGGATSTKYTGKLSNFSAYNRALSADEIRQNFNAMRGRYGF